MNPDRIEALDRLVPKLPELAPVRAALLSTSRSDADRAWSGSAGLGSVWSRLADLDAAETRLRELLEEEQAHLETIADGMKRVLRSAANGHADEAAETLLGIAALEEHRDRPDRAASYANSACEVLSEAPASALTARARRRRGRALRALGRYGEAEADYAASFRTASILGLPRDAAEAAIGAGNTVEDQGRWDEAEQWYRSALDQLAALDDEVPERWHALLNLHITLRWRGRLDEAIEALEQAESVAGALHDPSAAPFLLNARGQFEMARGRFEEGVRALDEALVRARGVRASVTIGLNLAEACLGAGNHTRATEEARRAEVAALTGRLHTKLPEVYRLLGRIAAEGGNADALALFERALDVIERHDLPPLERALTLQAYAAFERDLGEPETAEALADEAATIYRTLGIDGTRGPWADVFVSREENGTTS